MNIPNSPGRKRKAPVALVTYLRPYGSLAIISLLVRLGFTTAEREYDDDVDRIAAQLRPDMILVVLNPDDPRSETVIRRFVRNSNALLIAMAPGRRTEGFERLLEAGADLCVREGDEHQALAAQIRRVWTRCTEQPQEARQVLDCGPLQLDLDRFEVTWEGEQVALSPTELRVLACLASHRGQVVSAHEMMKAVLEYSPSERDARNMAKVYVRRVREKLRQVSGDPDLITTVRGFGYVMDSQPADADRPKVANR